MHQDVSKYNAAQKDDDRTICEALAAVRQVLVVVMRASRH
jgi:hypothetical protein